jgi:lipoprotein-releasing system permease protein
LSYELFIARRYLQSKQKTGFISVISFIAIGGVILGVASLIIMLSVTNGFAGEVRARLIGMSTHVTITRFHRQAMEDYRAVLDSVALEKGVVAAAPTVEAKLVIATKEGLDGVMVWGVDPASFGQVSELTQHLRYDESGELHLNRRPGQKYAGIVLGVQLAYRMGVGIGDEIMLLTMQDMKLEDMMMGGVSPRLERFIVTDLFESGMYHYDDTLAFISLSEAQRILTMGDAVSAIHLRVADLEEAIAVKERLADRIGYPYRFKDWTEEFPALFYWMELEKWVIFIALSLIIIVAAFNIMSILIMSILIKTPEIGILRAMGSRTREIRRIFVYQGLVIGGLGTALGCLVGLVVCWLQSRFDLISIPSEIYIISSLPVDMRATDFLLVSAVSITICLLASAYPARKAASLQPVEAIRYIT